MFIALFILAVALLALVIYKVRSHWQTEDMVKRAKARAEARSSYIGPDHEDNGIDYYNPVSKGIWTTDEVK
jgi:Tfp pilus assembly protein PilV